VADFTYVATWAGTVRVIHVPLKELSVAAC
jgi:hypothetical protein